MRLLGSVFYFLMQIVGYSLRCIPTFLKETVARVGAFLWLDIVGFRRRTLLLNLAFAFPRKPEESSMQFKKRIYSLARANLRHYFLGFFEIVEKTTWSDEDIKRNVVIKGLDHIKNATQDGTGVFLLNAHIGNWEAGLALSRWVGKPLSVIVRYVRNSFWDEALKRSREKFDVHLLPENASGIPAMRAYKKGELVAFVLDQHTGEPHGLKAKFFGLNAWTAKGLAVLSSRLEAKVIPTYSYREGGKIFVEFEAPLDFSDLGDCRDDALLLQHIQRCNDKIESWVRKYPDQYFWIHRRFKGHFNYATEKLPFP